MILTPFLKRKRTIPSGKINKILFVKLAAIGDTILLIPTIRSLKKAYPEAELTFLCTPVNFSVVNKIPYVDKVININVHSFLRNVFKFRTFLKEYRSIKYDISIDGGQWERMSTLMSVAAKAEYYIGFKTEGQNKHHLYDSVIDHSRTVHEAENFLDLLEPLNINITSEDKKLEYFLNANDYKFADDFWTENNLTRKKVIVFHPGCGINGKAREWEPERFVELGERLYKTDKEIRFIITGSDVEKDITDFIHNKLGNSAINLAGKAGVDKVIAVLKKANVVVCGNTGILHMAASVNSKIIALHGPTDPVKWGPYNDHSVVIQSDKFCSPCLYLGHDYGCSEPTCMSHITVDDVFIEVRKALSPELHPELNIVYN